MGTWDHGLLDNDTAMDGLGDLDHGVLEDIIAFGAAKPTTASTEKLCAAVGVMLQLSAYHFGTDNDDGPKIIDAVKAHAASIAKLAPPARKIMAAVMDGQGHLLAERPGGMSATLAGLLNVGSKKGRFGKREPALLETKAGAAYVQGIARRCVEAIDEDFEDEGNWSDLCREGMGMGMLAVLLVLEPCKVAPSKIERWRRNAKQGLAELEEAKDGELEFQRKYYANLDKVFAALLKRFA